MKKQPPPIIEPPNKHRKQGKEHKPFAIEAKFCTRAFLWGGKWFVWQRYKTRHGADQALRILTRTKSTLFGTPYMEFRLQDAKEQKQ